MINKSAMDITDQSRVACLMCGEQNHSKEFAKAMEEVRAKTGKDNSKEYRFHCAACGEEYGVRLRLLLAFSRPHRIITDTKTKKNASIK